MRNRAAWLGALALLAGSASARAQMKDVVEWLPAQTLACVEVRHPERLSREAAALIKGSALDDLPRRMARSRPENGLWMNWQARNQLSMMSTFLCPEMIDEAGRIRGGCVALTGFAKDNTPEVVAVLQTGGSNFPGIFMRAYLTSSQARIVGEVEGVSLYREQRIIGRPAVPQEQERDYGPVMAQVPGALLLGSSVDSLSEVIRRARGKSADTSLTSLRAFKDSAALRDRPGLFAYVDVTALSAQLDSQTPQAGGNGWARPWAFLKTALGQQSVRTLTASLTLHSGDLELLVRANLDGKADSRLLGLLPDKAAPRELLHFAPNDALLAIAGGFGEGEKRWQTYVTLLDDLDKLDGRGEANRPSKAIRAMEEKIHLRIGKDVLGPLTSAALVVDSATRGDSPAHPVLVLRAGDAEAARLLEEKGLPKLFGLAGGEVPLPTEEEMQGQRIRSVPGDMLPWRKRVHYGRRGAVLVIGLDRKRVAECLIAGGKKEGLLGEAKVASAVKEIDEGAVGVGVFSAAQAVMLPLAIVGRPKPMMKTPVPAKGPAVPPPPAAAEKEAEASAEVSKGLRDLRKIIEPMPPLVFNLKRQPDALVLEMRQSGLRRALPGLLDVWIDSILKGAGQGQDPIRATAPAPPAAKR